MGQREVLQILDKIKPKKVTLAYLRKKIKNCPNSLPTSLLKLRRSGMIKSEKKKRIGYNNKWDKNRKVYYYWVQ